MTVHYEFQRENYAIFYLPNISEKGKRKEESMTNRPTVGSEVLTWIIKCFCLLLVNLIHVVIRFITRSTMFIVYEAFLAKAGKPGILPLSPCHKDFKTKNK